MYIETLELSKIVHFTCVYHLWVMIVEQNFDSDENKNGTLATVHFCV